MAPTASKSNSKPKSSRAKTTDTGLYSTKRDKRLIKRSIFKSRIEKANQKLKKRRRPSNKLITNLESLADALPDGGDPTTREQADIIRHKSLKSRPGAMKRKEKLEKLERDRFAKNLAQMARKDEDPVTSAQGGSSSRWAALRNFITETMEQKEKFRAR